MFDTPRLLFVLVMVKLMGVCLVIEMAIFYFPDSQFILSNGFKQAPINGSRGESIYALDLPRTPQRYVPSRLLPQHFHNIVLAASHRYRVDPNLIWGIMKVESNFNARAVSRKGAKGLMQLMPGTARMHKVHNIYDPSQNLFGGVRHLRLLLDRFNGNIQLALAAYNAGSQAVRKYKRIPPYPETRKYVRRVLKYYQLYQKRGVIAVGRVTPPRMVINKR